MAHRTRAMIARDIRNAEANLALAKNDFEQMKLACDGFPTLIKKLSNDVKRLREEELRFRTASKQDQTRWKYGGEKAEEVPILGSFALLELAIAKAKQ